MRNPRQALLNGAMAAQCLLVAIGVDRVVALGFPVRYRVTDKRPAYALTILATAAFTALQSAQCHLHGTGTGTGVEWDPDADGVRLVGPEPWHLPHRRRQAHQRIPRTPRGLRSLFR